MVANRPEQRSRPRLSIGATCIASAFCLSLIPSAALSAEYGRLSAAVEHCSNHQISDRLNEDNTVLCFYGEIRLDADMAPFENLRPGGILVIRSPGGYAHAAMKIANILRAKDATVIVRDYCLSACANYILVATNRTHVKQKALVAWHGGARAQLTKTDCSGQNLEQLKSEYSDRHGPGSESWVDEICRTSELAEVFFKQRGLEARHIHAPQTAYTKKMVHFFAKQEWDKRKISWMWNPKNHGDYFKNRITYEAYPESQAEVDEILARERMTARMIYDPARF
jgi:hypothetical protein